MNTTILSPDCVSLPTASRRPNLSKRKRAKLKERAPLEHLIRQLGHTPLDAQSCRKFEYACEQKLHDPGVSSACVVRMIMAVSVFTVPPIITAFYFFKNHGVLAGVITTLLVTILCILEAFMVWPSLPPYEPHAKFQEDPYGTYGYPVPRRIEKLAEALMSLDYTEVTVRHLGRERFLCAERCPGNGGKREDFRVLYWRDP